MQMSYSPGQQTADLLLENLQQVAENSAKTKVFLYLKAYIL